MPKTTPTISWDQNPKSQLGEQVADVPDVAAGTDDDDESDDNCDFILDEEDLLEDPTAEQGSGADDRDASGGQETGPKTSERNDEQAQASTEVSHVPITLTYKWLSKDSIKEDQWHSQPLTGFTGNSSHQEVMGNICSTMEKLFTEAYTNYHELLKEKRRYIFVFPSAE